MTQARMIDVSSNNHPNDKPIDWQAVAGAGYGHVMIKCSEGAGYVNPWLKRDADGAARRWPQGRLLPFCPPDRRERTRASLFRVCCDRGPPARPRACP